MGSLTNLTQPAVFGLLYMCSWTERWSSWGPLLAQEHEEEHESSLEELFGQDGQMKTTKMASCSRLALGLSSRTPARVEGGQWLPSSGVGYEPEGVGGEGMASKVSWGCWRTGCLGVGSGHGHHPNQLGFAIRA